MVSGRMPKGRERERPFGFWKKFREILAFLKKIFYNRRQSIQQMSNQPTFLRAAAGLHKSRCIPVSGNSSRRNESWKEKYPQRP